MKIGEAKPTYYSNRQKLVDQIRDLASKKEKAEQKAEAEAKAQADARAEAFGGHGRRT